MSFIEMLKAYFASNRKITIAEHSAALKRIEVLESRMSGLVVNATADLERDMKQLKIKMDNLGLRVGFKAGSGIS